MKDLKKDGIPRRRWLSLLLCFAVIGGAFRLYEGGKTSTEATTATSDSARAVKPLDSRRASSRVMRRENSADEWQAELGAVTVRRASLIGEVAVEKSEVCPGEDLKISIQPAGDAEGTSFNIDGKFGNELVVSASMPDAESFWIVAARGAQRDFREVVVTVLSEQHPRCANAVAASIVLTADDWSGDTYHFEVVPVRGLVELAQVRWSFGDGQTQSGASRTSHSYAERPQASETSAFLVTAEVVDTEERRATARATVSLPNLHYQARMLGGPRVLPVEYDRFVGQQGNAAVRLNNIEAGPVRFEQAQVRLWSCNGLVREHSVAANDLLDSTVLPAGQVSEAQIDLPSTWTTAEVCRIELALTGDTEPSTSGQLDEDTGLSMRPVTANVTFELGMPKSVEEGGAPEFAGRPVTDPELEAALLEIMADKGTNYVTQEELEESKGGP